MTNIRRASGTECRNYRTMLVGEEKAGRKGLDQGRISCGVVWEELFIYCTIGGRGQGTF